MRIGGDTELLAGGPIAAMIAFWEAFGSGAAAQNEVEPPGDLPGPPFTGGALLHFQFMTARAQGAFGGAAPDPENQAAFDVAAAMNLLALPMSTGQQSYFKAARKLADVSWSDALEAAGISGWKVDDQRDLEQQAAAYFRAPPQRANWPYAFSIFAPEKLTIDFRGNKWMTGGMFDRRVVTEFLRSIGVTKQEAQRASDAAAGHLGLFIPPRPALAGPSLGLSRLPFGPHYTGPTYGFQQAPAPAGMRREGPVQGWQHAPVRYAPGYYDLPPPPPGWSPFVGGYY